MNLKKLYKRRSDGKIQEWQIIIDGNKYKTISGIYNEPSSIVESAWTTCFGKNIGKSNETSDEQQTVNEALAIYEDKISKKYHDNIDNVDYKKFISPMLAKEYSKYKDQIKFPVYSDPKLDGIRCTISTNGAYSRNGKKFLSIDYIEKEIVPLCKRYNLSFDGELYNHSLKDNFNKICSIVRTEEQDKDKSILYNIYDICSDEHIFSKRKEMIHEICSNTKFTTIVKSTLCHNQEELDQKYDDYLDEGYEGQIIRIDAVYEFKRTKSLLKRKEFITDEFTILDIIEGNGGREGTAGKFRLTTKQGEVFDANPVGTFETIKGYLDSKDSLIGKMCTVKYFRLTPRGVPKWANVIGIRDYE